ncbi:hypothetical protein B0H13DRAFT_2113495 [Mycena leptocephala]|nr:hypothetical protein B0H13DRAFT_2113495 [Mycena leptocephala]
MRLCASLLLADAVSVNGLSSVPRPTDPALSVNGLSFGPAASNNKGKIAGGVVAGLAVLLALLLTAAFLIRRRSNSKASTTQWRNRVGGWRWQRDAEGAAPPNPPGAAAKFAPSGVGKREPGAMGQVHKPLISQPLVGYDYWQDIKAPVASPVQPLFVREPRIGVNNQAEADVGHRSSGSK